jgi:hypothetical protein
MQLRIIISNFLFLVVLLSSCNSFRKQGNEKTNSGDSFNLPDTISTDSIDPKILEYKNFIQKLDSSNALSVTKALVKFKEVFKDQSLGLCDSGFVVFQSLYDTIELKLNQQIQKDTTNFEPLVNNENVSGKLKEYNQTIRQNGFKFSWIQGMVYIEEDRNYLVQNFYPYLSEVMKNYLNEIKTENAEGFATDKAITISPQKLVERIIWYEKFNYENPDFVYIHRSKNFQKAYLSYLLSGYENTRLHKSNENSELSDYFTTAYTYLLTKFPGSETAKLVDPYFTALKQKQTSVVNQIYKDYVIKGLILNINKK